MELPKNTVILWDNSPVPSGWSLLHSPTNPLCIRGHSKGTLATSYQINSGQPHTHTAPSESSVHNFSHSHVPNGGQPVTISNNWIGNHLAPGQRDVVANSVHSHTLHPTVVTETTPHTHSINFTINNASVHDVTPECVSFRLIVKN